VSGLPVLLIADQADVKVTVVDLRTFPDDVRERNARLRLQEENLRPFDLTTGPLVRATLFRLADDDHWLALTFHHIVFDGWSEGVLWRELGALYGAFTSGRPSRLPHLGIGYGDYAAWQRRAEQGEECARQLAYWK